MLLTLAVLLPQLQLRFERQGWPDVVILIDDSQSMSAVDRYRDPAVQQAALGLAQLEGLTEADRLHLAQLLLTRSNDDWLTALLKRRMKAGVWKWLHRLSYGAFALIFFHAVLSGTDFSDPVVSAITWATAAALLALGLTRAVWGRLPA